MNSVMNACGLKTQKIVNLLDCTTVPQGRFGLDAILPMNKMSDTIDQITSQSY